jgi:hypothetical protein
MSNSEKVIRSIEKAEFTVKNFIEVEKRANKLLKLASEAGITELAIFSKKVADGANGISKYFADHAQTLREAYNINSVRIPVIDGNEQEEKPPVRVLPGKPRLILHQGGKSKKKGGK